MTDGNPHTDYIGIVTKPPGDDKQLLCAGLAVRHLGICEERNEERFVGIYKHIEKAGVRESMKHFFESFECHTLSLKARIVYRNLPPISKHAILW